MYLFEKLVKLLHPCLEGLGIFLASATTLADTNIRTLFLGPNAIGAGCAGRLNAVATRLTFSNRRSSQLCLRTFIMRSNLQPSHAL